LFFRARSPVGVVMKSSGAFDLSAMGRTIKPLRRSYPGKTAHWGVKYYTRRGGVKLRSSV
jgi:hypothetical protein